MTKEKNKVYVSFSTKTGKVFRFSSKKPKKSRFETKRLYFMEEKNND